MSVVIPGNVKHSVWIIWEWKGTEQRESNSGFIDKDVEVLRDHR